MSTQDAMQVAIAANIPYLVVGAPGLGKTSYHTALAETCDANLEVIISSLRDPTDFAGLPIKVANKAGDPGVYLAPPLWAKRANEHAAKGEQSWVLFDEITTAAPATQAALLRVIHERWVGDMQLDPSVRVMAAANPSDQAAGGWDLTPPLANRFLHLNWTVSPGDWADGIIAGFPMPDPLQVDEKAAESMFRNNKVLVASFVKNAGREHLINVPKDDAKAGGAWPPPRTWEMAAKLMAYREAAGLAKDVDLLLLRGTVGDAEAMAFKAWMKDQNLPNPEALLKKPADFKLPERGDVVYTVLNSVVAAVIGNKTPARWKAGWTILKLAGEQGAYDVGCQAARLLAEHSDANLDVPLDEIKPYLDMLVQAGFIKKGATN